MGEVYRAKDSKLKRDVAIKVLPQSLATDPDALPGVSPPPTRRASSTGT
jgi:hypothetical protein